jgi:hypothetical protein
MRHIPCSFPKISFYLHALNSPSSFGEKLAHQHVVVHIFGLLDMGLTLGLAMWTHSRRGCVERRQQVPYVGMHNAGCDDSAENKNGEESKQ